MMYSCRLFCVLMILNAILFFEKLSQRVLFVIDIVIWPGECIDLSLFCYFLKKYLHKLKLKNHGIHKGLGLLVMS